MMPANTTFLHGLDSSSRGTKATWFHRHFPSMLIPDFQGGLQERMAQLDAALAGRSDLLLIGSSYGGLMAAIYAIEHEFLVRRLILLVPALNFPDFTPWRGRRCHVPTSLYIGRTDEVTPLPAVVAAASDVFSRLDFHAVEDDHLLRRTFETIDWNQLLAD
jgi:pimeloyl-ACP methyl ester carboxylesterase